MRQKYDKDKQPPLDNSNIDSQRYMSLQQQPGQVQSSANHFTIKTSMKPTVASIISKKQVQDNQRAGAFTNEKAGRSFKKGKKRQNEYQEEQ